LTRKPIDADLADCGEKKAAEKSDNQGSPRVAGLLVLRSKNRVAKTLSATIRRARLGVTAVTVLMKLQNSPPNFHQKNSKKTQVGSNRQGIL
jgi:hypothetical protein